MAQSSLAKVINGSYCIVIIGLDRLIERFGVVSAGWIEFADKKIAKMVAESLNNTSIGGKKGGFYHDDIWNLKYLKNFK